MPRETVSRAVRQEGLEVSMRAVNIFCICAGACLCVWTFIQICVRVCVCVCVRARVCVRACVYLFIFVSCICAGSRGSFGSVGAETPKRQAKRIGSEHVCLVCALEGSVVQCKLLRCNFLACAGVNFVVCIQ